MCLFSRGDKKKSKVQAWSVHFRTPEKASLGIPTAVHTLQVSPSFAPDALLGACTALELCLLQNLDHCFRVPFVHVFIIPINCCRIRNDNFSASCQTPGEEKSCTWMMR